MATNVASIGVAAAESVAVVDMDMKEDWLLQTPSRFVILDIDCTLASGALEFSFRDPRGGEPLSGGLQGAISAALTRPSGPGSTRYAPLDIGLSGDSAYVFLRIVGPTNMTFSASKKALTHKNADDRDYYGELRHVVAGAQPSERPLANCKIVYFIADPLSPPAQGYEHGFFLNVEIEQTATNGAQRLIAFEIDPDVRHPGGTPV